MINDPNVNTFWLKYSAQPWTLGTKEEIPLCQLHSTLMFEHAKHLNSHMVLGKGVKTANNHVE